MAGRHWHLHMKLSLISSRHELCLCTIHNLIRLMLFCVSFKQLQGQGIFQFVRQSPLFMLLAHVGG